MYKGAAGLENNVSKHHAKMDWLWSHDEWCEHADMPGNLPG